jgi:hypothetical protein
MMEIKSSHFENTDIDNLGFGAGVLPYAIDEHGEIHVLLGRERFVSSWKGSCTWSGFEGSKKDNETIANTAIREFIEESLGVVLNEQEISTIINDKTYVIRIVLKIIKHSLKERYHCTYVVQIPWDTTIPDKFRETRHIIERINRMTQEWKHMLPCFLKNIDCVGPIKIIDDGGVCTDCDPNSTPCMIRSPWKIVSDGDNSVVRAFVEGQDSVELLKWGSIRQKLEDIIIDHPCIKVTRDDTFNQIKSVDIGVDHLEKDQVRWWRASDLNDVLKNKGILGHERFRPYFLPVLQTFLKEIVEHDSPMCQPIESADEFSEYPSLETVNSDEGDLSHPLSVP